jgi:hypothetical protein
MKKTEFFGKLFLSRAESDFSILLCLLDEEMRERNLEPHQRAQEVRELTVKFKTNLTEKLYRISQGIL